MPKYIIYFNQQWVGEHSKEWFHGRGPLARAVVAEMETVDVLVFAGGLVEEIEEAIGFDESGHEVGPITSTQEFVGGLTIIDEIHPAFMQFHNKLEALESEELEKLSDTLDAIRATL